MNRHYALRSDDEVRAFLTFPEQDGVNLRRNYVAIMHAIKVVVHS
eukprot:CAMPEP_0175866752 /NCGR_PEP_ID=MMETSP0107_2-20121207/34402_1 /TAXON_ID=195067 ORGANISM="Goniomonas pacifica, Strain CCMP1869" /NCGR_SAMPLE_ID=MMETSP0107_2 /ASSEMBLY_ACC=CAM_ASM_000203 /LENGTH=44 /DNA_ID= /DNA_START= /DNA_END= /DNA_ORIENTATION=